MVGLAKARPNNNELLIFATHNLRIIILTIKRAISVSSYSNKSVRIQSSYVIIKMLGACIPYTMVTITQDVY